MYSNLLFACSWLSNTSVVGIRGDCCLTAEQILGWFFEWGTGPQPLHAFQSIEAAYLSSKTTGYTLGQ